MRAALVFAALAFLPGAVRAASVTIDMARPRTTLELRLYALGIMPIDGQFELFQGRFTVDPDLPGRCSVELTAQVGSLSLGDDDMRRDAISAEFLDAASFPTLHYAGDCSGGGIEGSLTMHGVTRPLRLDLERDRSRYVATGSLRRAEWGVVGRPNVAGATVRIRVTTELPQ